MLDKIRILVGRDDIEDAVLEIYIDRAVRAITLYLNNPRITEEFVIENYEDAVILMVENAFSTRDKKFVKSYTQGKRSVSHSESVLQSMPDEVKNLLPRPYARFM